MTADPRELGGDIRRRGTESMLPDRMAQRHAVMSRRCLGLGERDSLSRFDVLDAKRAIGAPTREDHTDRSTAEIISQRAAGSRWA